MACAMVAYRDCERVRPWGVPILGAFGRVTAVVFYLGIFRKLTPYASRHSLTVGPWGPYHTSPAKFLKVVALFHCQKYARQIFKSSYTLSLLKIFPPNF